MSRKQKASAVANVINTWNAAGQRPHLNEIRQEVDFEITRTTLKAVLEYLLKNNCVTKEQLKGTAPGGGYVVFTITDFGKKMYLRTSPDLSSLKGLLNI